MRFSRQRRSSGNSYQHPVSNDGMLAVEDLLWLAAVRAAQKRPGRKLSVPPGVLERFVAGGLIEQHGESFRLTHEGLQILERFL